MVRRYDNAQLMPERRRLVDFARISDVAPGSSVTLGFNVNAETLASYVC